jgi:dihydroflavonol-4-reductase
MDLVTGATGHIGNVLVRTLLEKGRQVRALILPGEDRTPVQNLDIEIVPGDVLHPESLPGAFDGIEHVYHLAGIISILPGRNRLLERVNIEGTQNIVNAALQAKVKRLVYTSSIHAISRAPHGTTIDENVPFDTVHALSEYDRSKAVASLTVLASICQGLDAVIACPTGVIGPYDYRISEMGKLILDCVCKKYQFYVDGAYDFVDVRDVAQGLIQTCEKGRTGNTYILSGEQISVKRLLETIWNLTGGRFSITKIPMNVARFAARFTPLYYRLMKIKPRFTLYSLDTLESNCSISHQKAAEELGYAPRSLKESLADTIEWFRQNPGLWMKAAQRSG